MSELITLHYHDVSPLRPFHAAAATFRRRGDSSSGRHDHDFYETMLVLEGAGVHWLNGVEEMLTPGDLFLIRPWDRHGISLGGRSHLHFMNVAFPSDSWSLFASLTLSDSCIAEWRIAQRPVTAKLGIDEFDRTAESFRRLSLASDRVDERLELVRFWTEIVSVLGVKPAMQIAPSDDGPQWLARALAGMNSPERLAGGVPALVEACGVSAAHLSRTLKALKGVTPTQLVNDARLRRSALLLATSSMEIVDIAFECGFENLSYFYREFRKQYGSTPRKFRIDERRRIAPG